MPRLKRYNATTHEWEYVENSYIETDTLPSVGNYEFWEPSDVPTNFSCTPLGQSSQSIPALSAIGYDGFLSTYFDTYLWQTYADGYTVTREDLGLDSAASLTGNIEAPIYSYTFAPKRYRNTILLSAGMNPCEASTYFGLAMFVKALMEHTEQGMRDLYNTTRFVIIPILCPSGIYVSPFRYYNANGARINKNFSYKGSWKYIHDNQTNQHEGSYPDSEVETKILKNWVNRYPNSLLWIDCHSDTQGGATIIKHIGAEFCSDSWLTQRLINDRPKVVNYYKAKGYISDSDTIHGSPSTSTSPEHPINYTYPKTTYAWEVLHTHAMMIEQFCYSTAWGSDGDTNNDTYGIKHFCGLLRWACLAASR